MSEARSNAETLTKSQLLGIISHSPASIFLPSIPPITDHFSLLAGRIGVVQDCIYIVQDVSYIVQDVSYIVQDCPYIVQNVPYIVQDVSYIVQNVPYIV